ncbi:MAG: hypothetical protein NVS1B11_00420 [Terriglobales bacterium]
MIEAPKLLIEWSSPWEEFRSAIGPALGRSPRPLAGEARTGLFPYQGMLCWWLIQALFLIAAVALQDRLATMRVYMPPSPHKYDVIYFSGDELPRTDDASGAQAGRAGSSGGQEARHATQTIRVARGATVHEQVVDAPKLNLPHSDSAVANLLAYKVVSGAPPVSGLHSSARVQELSQAAIAPSPEIERENMRSRPELQAAVIPPAPSTPQTVMVRLNVPGNHPMEVVPPPVSAPEQATIKPRLTLPASAVVAPAPERIVRTLANGPGFGADELHKQVVPPPAQVEKISSDRRAGGGLGKAEVVAPPVEVASLTTGRRTSNGFEGTAVVPPPAQLNGSLGRSGLARPSGEASIVAPSPALNGGVGGRNSGRGTLDAPAVDGPPAATANKNGSGIVLSSQPGSEVKAPGKPSMASLALSPSGGSKPGRGGGGGGSSINHGTGAGSGLESAGSGARKEGAGRGSETTAHAGISPTPGSGGAGSGTNGQPPMPGVSVHGGNNSVTLPSFGTSSSAAPGPDKMAANSTNQSLGITVVGTSRSGGAFNFYGTLKGDKVYTIYIETSLGTAVMQYADPASATHPYAEDLVAPQPMRADLPPNLKNSRLVIACILDRSGILRNTQVLEPGSGDMTNKVLAALPNWKFRPVLRGEQPVEVNAILGFDIDTR